jgi:hypothetical protein
VGGTGRSGRSSRPHHANHRPLLAPLGAKTPWARARIDGIAVPTHRSPQHILTAFDVAQRLQCPVITICGGAAEIPQIITLAEIGDVRCYALEADDVAGNRYVPRAVRAVHDASTRQRIVPAARNVSLLIARLAGWRRMLFLDDDISSVHVERLKRAGRRLQPGELAAAGWVAHHYPDNSVVCHANRLVGNPQGTFIGAGTLVTAVTETTPTFPAVYNEDWFFLFDLIAQREVAHGGTVLQLAFDPFRTPERAVHEEFGDLVAEGLYHRLHELRAGDLTPESLRPAIRDAGYWASELDGRAVLIDRIADRLAGGMAPAGTETSTVERALASLAAARTRLTQITTGDVVGFVDAWHDDQATWRQTMHDLHPLGSLPAALDRLGIEYVTTVKERTA